MATTFPIETVVLDRTSTVTLHRQIYNQLRSLIERKALASGSALPSTRLLSKDLGIGRNSVIAAYDQLALEGYLRIRRGASALVIDLPEHGSRAGRPRIAATSYVSERGKAMQKQRYHHGKPGLLAFHPGLPDPDNFPFNTWSKLLARRTKTARHSLFGAYHINGYPPLREAIARYLTASRGVNCTANQIVVTNGAQSALDLLARMLIDPGDAVWMEEPGYYGATAAFLSAGAKLSALNVSDMGWALEPPKSKPRLIFVTPSCHNPLGVTMPMEQRLKLIRVAESWNSWIIEDDYDSEYRFQGQPIPALQGLDVSNRVVYVGTFAKMLFPAMRLGFMVVPETICDGMIAALSATGQFAPLLTQAALADFINEGHLPRHLRRMRRLYAVRRQYFMNVCDDYLGDWLHLRRSESGIQMVGLLRQDCDDRAVAAAILKLGINVSSLSTHYHGDHGVSGLLMGFAASDEKATLKAIRKLRQFFSSGGTGPHPRRTLSNENSKL
ncbi:MAG: PLP-dependent aminotransferase family protein [Hyphomicrobiales bacterium]|nr:PLP-dependent aminotransferase family protein [Hyphomicrobiales bacterium]